jgi:hypothetical protein
MGRFNNLNLVASWFGLCFFTLVFSVVLLLYISTYHIITLKHSNFKLYAALPAENIEMTDAVDAQDGRSLIIQKFFQSRGSALAPTAIKFVSVADEYDLDYRLLPSIAMQESNGGKIVPDNSFNPFGFGIYGGKVRRFTSWEEGIEVVGKSIRENYLDKGLTTPYQIMAKYTPPSLEKGGPWAIGVDHFMDLLK